MARPVHALLHRCAALTALVVLAAFVPLTSGLTTLGDDDCDCATRHQDGDDEDNCPPFCGSCLDCAGCFHVHAIVTVLRTAVPAALPVIVRLGAPTLAARPPDAPRDEPVHVPLRVA